MAEITLSGAVSRRKKGPKEELQLILDDILPFISRPSDKKDPKEAVGGSIEYIRRKLQALNDVAEHHVKLHEEIAKANMATTEIAGVTRTLHQWNHLRDVVLPTKLEMLRTILTAARSARSINHAMPRQTAIKRGTEVATAPIEEIINIDEEVLAGEILKLTRLKKEIHEGLNEINQVTKIQI